jgi:GT2 family glycosyltransferase
VSSSEPSIQIVVVNWNTAGELGRCLESIAASERAPSIEVVVVDNGSSDGSRELVSREHPEVRLHEPSENLGFGRAVNLGASGSHTEWLVAANADIEVGPTTLADLAEVLASVPQDVGVVAPRLLGRDGRPQRSVFADPRLSDALAAGVGLHRLSRRVRARLRLGASAAPDRAGDVDYAMGAFLAVRRQAFDRVGGFDDRQWMYAEDLDICWRLRRAGWRVRYEPGIDVVHVGGASTSQLFADEEVSIRILAAAYTWLELRRGARVAKAFYAIQLASAQARAFVARARRRARVGDWSPSPAEGWVRIIHSSWQRRPDALSPGSAERVNPAERPGPA